MQTVLGWIALILICFATIFVIKNSDTMEEVLLGTVLYGIILVYIAWTLFGA